MDAPAIVQSPDGSRIAAAWMDRRNGNQNPDVWLSIATGGKFGAEGSITSESDGAQNHPTLAYEAKTSTVYGVWEDGRKGGKSIHGCAVGKSRVEWAVSDDADGGCSFPVVAAGGGLVVVTYEAQGGSEARLRVLADGK